MSFLAQDRPACPAMVVTTGSHLGRVGGLAAVLGVGVAVAVSLGTPTAWADDGGVSSHEANTPSKSGAQRKADNKVAARHNYSRTAQTPARVPAAGITAPAISTPPPPAGAGTAPAAARGGPSSVPRGGSGTDAPLLLGLLNWSRRQGAPAALAPSTAGAVSTGQPLATSTTAVPTAAVAKAATPMAAGVPSSITVSSPVGVAVSSDGAAAYVLSKGSAGFFGIGATRPSVSVVDAHTGQVGVTTALAAAGTGIVAGSNGNVYVLSSGSSGFLGIGATGGAVTVLNAVGAVTKTISVGSSPADLAVAGGNLYVLNAAAGRTPSSVMVIDTATNTLTRTVTLGSPAAALAVSPTGALYVTTKGSSGFFGIGATSSQVQAIDPTTGAVTQTITTGTASGRIALSPDAATAYVLNAGSAGFFGLGGKPGSLSIIDTATGQVRRTVSVGAAASDVIVSPDGNQVYVANGDDTITVIDPTMIRTLPLDTTPTAGAQRLAISPDSTTAYVTDGPDNRVRVVSLADLIGRAATSLGTVSFPGYPQPWPVASADGTHALFADGSQLALINPVTGAQTGSTVALPGTVSGMPLLTADGAHALITATVTDPVTGPSTRVAWVDTATGTQTGAAFTLPGTVEGSVLTADGSRALIETTIHDPIQQTSRVAIFNTATGTQTGTTLAFAGAAGNGPVLLAGGTHVMITNFVSDPLAHTNATQVAFIDTATGAQIGTVVTIPGVGTPQLSADGSHALIVTSDYNPTNGATSNRMAFIDTATGIQTGTTVTLPGSSSTQLLLGANGSKALITTTTGNILTGYTTRVAVYNTSTGAQTGNAMTIAGIAPVAPVLAADGVSAVVTALSLSSGRVAVFNTSTGRQTGSTLSFTGGVGVQLLGGDIHRALIVTQVYDSGTSTYTSRVTVADPTTGRQTGTALTLPGSPSGFYTSLLSADGHYALVTTDTAGGTQVAVLNTITGTQVGGTLVLTGTQRGTPALLADGTHALIATEYEVTTVDLTTAAPINTLVPTTGYVVWPVLLTAKGTRVLVTTYDGSSGQVTVLPV